MWRRNRNANHDRWHNRKIVLEIFVCISSFLRAQSWHFRGGGEDKKTKGENQHNYLLMFLNAFTFNWPCHPQALILQHAFVFSIQINMRYRHFCLSSPVNDEWCVGYLVSSLGRDGTHCVCVWLMIVDYEMEMVYLIQYETGVHDMKHLWRISFFLFLTGFCLKEYWISIRTASYTVNHKSKREYIYEKRLVIYIYYAKKKWNAFLLIRLLLISHRFPFALKKKKFNEKCISAYSNTSFTRSSFIQSSTTSFRSL